jgi:hypothetical protein
MSLASLDDSRKQPTVARQHSGPGGVPPVVAAVRVLMVTFGSLTAPRDGGTVRARTLLEGLADLGAETTVISANEPATAGPALAPLGVTQVVLLRGRLRLGWSLEVVRAMRRLAPHADVLLVESALLLPAVLAARTRRPIVLDETECETLHYRRRSRTLSNRIRGAVWFALEYLALQRCAVTIAVSQVEAAHWASLFPRANGRLMVVQHRPAIAPLAVTRDPEAVRDPTAGGRITLLFIGWMGAKHNSDAARWLLEVLAPRLPASCRLVIAGPASERFAAPPRLRVDVRCLGAVDDLDSLIRTADFCLAPLAAGAGIKTKVLHYLAHSRRVIATPLAMEGIDDPPGVVTAPLEGFAEMVLDQLDEIETPVEAASRAADQHRWFAANHSASRTAQELGLVMDAAMEGRTPAQDRGATEAAPARGAVESSVSAHTWRPPH